MVKKPAVFFVFALVAILTLGPVISYVEARVFEGCRVYNGCREFLFFWGKSCEGGGGCNWDSENTCYAGSGYCGCCWEGGSPGPCHCQ